MTQPLSLTQEWKSLLGLADRQRPELYESPEAVADVPHALAIRAALEDLGLSAIFCVQGVPTVAILSTDEYDRERVVNLHGALWNQGLASLLLIISGDTLRAFSLARKPYRQLGEDFDRRCLVETLKLTADAAARFRDLLYGAESGRLWKDHSEYFKPSERIDKVLLDNLKEAHQLLCNAKLSSHSAQALLIQAMFIAYLEDREIITADYFREVSRSDEVHDLSSLLSRRSVKLFRSLFTKLREHFNGDLFFAPCSFESQDRTPEIQPEHLDILARFRTGLEEMGQGGQLRFWGYNFRYIPIELVSAVYDRFLEEKEEQRREQGAYYTPMFLADTVVSQAWELIPPEVKEKGRYLDPACGSGVFLVRSFQRLCEHWRITRRSRTIRWDSLIGISERVHGWDVNTTAVRVAVFSLYVALLEEVSPPDLRRLISRGKILPDLWGRTLVCKDFFDIKGEERPFNVIIGNPPWASRRGPNRPSVRWTSSHELPMPGGEDAWAFAWKAVEHLTDDGIIAFLLPAMGFLHNHAVSAVAARHKFLEENRVFRIINFADLRFQLFERARRPTALIIYGKTREKGLAYRFDYWAPKADLNLQIKRVITLSSADKFSISATTVAENPLALKQRLWMREPEAKLFAYLSGLPRLGALVKDFGGISRRKEQTAGEWVIGQGFQPLNDQADEAQPRRYSISRYVGKLPDLPIAAFQRLAQPISGLQPWHSRRVRRKGFEAGFEGPRILVPRGVETSQVRLRATFTDHPLTFQHIIQAITVPPNHEVRGKLLTGLLNSRVAVWYAFHGTASFGSDRPEVQQAELLRLPFPSPADLPEPRRAEAAARKLVGMVDDAIRMGDQTFTLDANSGDVLPELDRTAYEYFCLSVEEIALIEDSVEQIIPAVQPHEGSYPAIWSSPTKDHIRVYAQTLVASVSHWFQPNGSISARLEGRSADLGVLRLSLEGESTAYTEAADAGLAEVLGRISEHIRQPLSGNFQITPDLRVFAGKHLYLIKPMQLRFWLRTSALADADSIAMDLQDAMKLQRHES